MSYILVNHRVKDYSVWKPYFDEDIKLQVNSGIMLKEVFCAANDSNNVFILFETNDLEKATEFFTNPRLKELMHTAGVISEPQVNILEKAK